MSKKLVAGAGIAALFLSIPVAASAATPEYEAAYAKATACMNNVMASELAQNEAEWGGVEPHTPEWEAKLVEIAKRDCATDFANLDKIKKADDLAEAASVPGSHVIPGEQRNPGTAPEAGDLNKLNTMTEKELAELADGILKGDQKELDKVGMSRPGPALSNNQLNGELVNAVANAEKAYKDACKVNDKGVPTVRDMRGACLDAKNALDIAKAKLYAFGEDHKNERGGAPYDPAVDPAKVKNVAKGLTNEEAKKLAEGKKAGDKKDESKKDDAKKDGAKKADAKKADAKAADAKKGGLAKTGATVGILGGIAAAAAAAGAVAFAIRKRA